MNEHTLKKSIIFLLALSLLTPLIAWKGAAPDYTLVRSMVFFFIVEIAFSLYLFLVYKNRKYSPLKSVIFALVLSFFVINVASFFMSQDMPRSFWGTWNRSIDSGLLAHIHYLLFFIVFAGVVRKKDEWLFLLKTGLIGSLVISFIGFIQLFKPPLVFPADPFGDLGLGRIQSTLANPIVLATYMGMYALLSLFVLTKYDSDKLGNSKYIAYTLVFFSIVSLIGSASRGPMLGLIAFVSFFVISIIFIRNKKILLHFVYLVAVVLVVGTTIHLVDFDSTNNPVDRMAAISTEDSSVANRLRTWKIAVVGIVDKPYFGWGQEGFSYLFDQNYDPEFLTSETAETWWDRAHNIYLDIASVNGIIGLVFYISLLVAAFVLSLRINVFLSGVFLFYAVAGLTFFDVLATYIALYFALALVHFLLIEKKSSKNTSKFMGLDIFRILERLKNNHHKSIIGSNFIFICAIIVIVIALANSIVFINIARANYYMNKVGDLFYEDAIGSFEKSLSIKIPGAYKNELRYEFTSYVADAYRLGVIPSEKLDGDFKLAKKSIEVARQEHKKDARVGWLAAHLANSYFDFKNDESLLDDAEFYETWASINSPGRQQILYERAQTQTNRGDFDGAVQTLHMILNLNRNFPGAYFTLGLGYLAAGGIDKGLEYIEFSESVGYKLKGGEAQSWLMIAGIYYDQQNYERMIEIYAKLIEIFPNNIDFRRFIAITYLEAGMFAEAEEAAMSLLEIDPSLKPQIDEFISNLYEVKGGDN